jgi:hypothetical protein
MKGKNKRTVIFICLSLFIILISFFLLGGCKGANKLNPDIDAPQMVVNPDTIRLGVAHITGTDIVFEGSGFHPEDSVFISLIGPDNTQVVIADGKIYRDGTFRAQATPLAKIIGILKANITGTYNVDGTYNQILVITRDPIPPGVYKARAHGMISDQSAETTFTIRKSSLKDRIKDWVGVKMGKIQIRRN